MTDVDVRYVDVFTATAYLGNPVAVVHDADGLDTASMQRIASWTNLSETTFLLTPSAAEADYGVRIFTPSQELPFAGHPTLGSCHAWLEAGGLPSDDDLVVQECGAGLVRISRGGGRLAFAAPPLVRAGPVDASTLARVVAQLKIAESDVVASQWADNGPGWVAVLLRDADAVLALRPTGVDLDIGVVGPLRDGSGEAFEVRAFFPHGSSTVEDPVTGSLNASLAQWLIATGMATAPYVARQGTALGRAGRVYISTDADGQVWVGGGTVTCVTGRITVA